MRVGVSSYSYLCSSQLMVAGVLHNGSKQGSDTVVSAICDSLRRGNNWDTLSRKFCSVELNDLLVKNVLLELKEPTDAKRALGFFHWSSRRKNFVHAVQSYCLVVNILVRAELIRDAQVLLISILKKSCSDSSKFLVVDSLLSTYRITISTPVVFNLLIQAYAKLRQLEIGFEVCCYLEDHGFSISITSFNILIHFVQKSDQNPLAWKIYKHMIQRRVYPNDATIRTMINALCKEGKLNTFVETLDRIHGKRCMPLIIINTCLVFRVFEEGRIEDAMALLKGMLQKNMIHDTIAFSLTIYAKLKLENFEAAFDVYEEMLKRGFDANSFMHTSFIEASCNAGDIEKAKELFEEMGNTGLKPYNESFNALIAGCADAGKVEESLSYCEKMIERGLVPSILTFNKMIAKLSETGKVKEANDITTCLIDKGFEPNEMTYVHLIAGFEKENQVEEVLKLYYELEFRSISPGILVFGLVIRSLCRNGRLEQAEKYLRIMKDRSLNPGEDVYEALIAAYIERGGMRKEVVHVYNEMVSRGLKPCCLYNLDANS
ncbi:pentatricopeptide repeat-containing protein At1g66345, mitochondrial isoform X2 [Euphorbia lathyris]|uniref:pentatricopeptide repeat-containing protein At1g66345, mitochondrial isoform X2 n=1 Tax=Euphorbia lathyris TaxID=212925 RepID=UPI00331406F7